MSDKKVKTVKVPEARAEEWEEYADETPEVDSVSHLIRLSVQKEISGKYDVEQRRAPDENAGMSGEVLTHLQKIQTSIEDVEGRLSALEEVESEEAGYDLKKAVFEVLPPTPDEAVTATTEPEIPASAPNFPEDTEAMTAQEVAQKLGAEVNDVQDTLKDLAENTGQVFRSDTNHDGRHYWKKGQ
ncbi:hypothetical protein [Haloarcula marina]|uniref:hypothetical protein n=1 Tax=Haloarcula marina TaxID=2961574 RepID=UPI0020B8B906|nr:hypothetical protein [Halomicroarcula marina]